MEGRASDWIERAVVESDRRRCAAKVALISAEDAVERGDNYLSNLKRLTLDVVLNSGERQTRKLIYKAFPEGENRVLLAKKNGIFVREIRVFHDVIPEMENIWREKEPVAEFLWPQLFSTQGLYEGLLIEDLSVKGFKMGNRLKGLDYEHCKLVVRSLSKFHALGAILRKNGDLRIKDFYPAAFNEESSAIPDFFGNLFRQCADVMEKDWKDEWIDFAKRLRILSKTIDDKIKEEYKKDDSKFLTLNHGDCWVNNILFRYDKNGNPVALRFIDFQLSHYNTPVFDLHYFFQTSAGLDVREKKLELIQEYHESLSENLNLFGYPESEIPTLVEIKELYKNARFFGFCMGLAIVPIMLAPKERAKTDKELDDLSKKLYDKEKVDFGLFGRGDEYSNKIIKFTIKEGVENGIL